MPLIHGGIQENGRRGGTENVPGIVGLGKAAELAENRAGVRRIRDRMKAGIRELMEGITFTGHPYQRLPGHLSLCIEAIEGEALIFLLAAEGIYVNTGSACASKALKTSPVLVAIEVPADLAQGSVQIRDIARRQDISIKYIEQLIIPLKKAGFITSFRGPKGGHLLPKPPETITAGDIVRVLENEIGLVQCIENPKACERIKICPTRNLWKMATRALYEQLNGVTLAELVKTG